MRSPFCTSLVRTINREMTMINAILKQSAWIALLALITGCSTVRPLVEVSHTSHVTQHFGNNKTNYGWNVYSLGVRWRPSESVTVDLLDGYSPDKLDGRHEVFNGRLTWEIGKQ